MKTIADIPPDLATRSKAFYRDQLQAILEPAEIGKFVAIEPYLERYFVALQDIEALLAARAALPDKVFFLVRIGYDAAHKIGGVMYARGKRPNSPLR